MPSEGPSSKSFLFSFLYYILHMKMQYQGKTKNIRKQRVFRFKVFHTATQQHEKHKNDKYFGFGNHNIIVVNLTFNYM